MQQADGDGTVVREGLGRVHLLEYTHLDWAWCFTREWHWARYVRILEEAFQRTATDDSFRFFVDSLCEAFLPYLEAQPGRVAEVAAALASGQLAVVGGQYANLRPATAPEETYLRNIQEGRRTLAEWFPGVSPVGYANMDTALGHSQLPQIMALAGYRYMMVGRPELGLELDAVPKLFRWQGAGGSEVLVLVQHYGILEGGLRGMASGETEMRRTGAEACRRLLAAHVAALPAVQWAFLAADDMRFRRGHVTDQPVDVPALLEAWQEEMGGEMMPSTPDLLYGDLGAHLSDVTIVRGAVDHADVGYNGPFGGKALRALRDHAAARLVEAEMAMALLGPEASWPEAELRKCWRLALRAQTHAVQYLFSSDLAQMRLDLANASRGAEKVRDAALAAVLPPALPHESRLVAVLNPLPRPARLTVPVMVRRTDFAVAGYVAQGRRQQALAPRNPGRAGEWEVLVEVDLPAGGHETVLLEPAEKTEARSPEELPATCTVVMGPLELRWKDGMLAGVRGNGRELQATPGSSLLEPIRRPAKVQGWMTTEMAAPGERCRSRWLRQTEFGPLRWAAEREAWLGGHLVWQRFVVDDTGDLEVVTEIDHGIDTCMFSLAVPCPDEARLRVSIPFGAEDRALSGVHYSPGGSGARVIERLIPGMLYARDWARFSVGGAPVALLVLDGDRYWLRRDGEGRLEHLLGRVCEPARDGWVSQTDLAGAGKIRARHALVLGSAASSEPVLDERVDRARHPVRCQYVQSSVALRRSWLAIEPEHVRFLSLRRVGGELELKVVENGDRAVEAEIVFARPVSSARLVDLLGHPLPTPVHLDDNRLSFPIAPRQIRILRVLPARPTQAHNI